MALVLRRRRSDEQGTGFTMTSINPYFGAGKKGVELLLLDLGLACTRERESYENHLSSDSSTLSKKCIYISSYRQKQVIKKYA